jgi:hypothetical protein
MSDDKDRYNPMGEHSDGGDDRNPVTELIRETVAFSERSATALPPVDVAAILEGTTGQRRKHPTAALVATRFRTWVPRAAAAAAALAVAATTLFLLRPGSLPETQIPPYLTALVDSLYPESDYVQDEMASVLWPDRTEDADGYLDEVWESVISEIGEL